MDLILIPFRDLLKYKIVSLVNTGDKNGDTAFTTFYIACISFILSKEIWVSIYNWLYYYYCIWYIKRHPHIKTTKIKKIIELIGRSGNESIFNINMQNPDLVKKFVHYVLLNTVHASSVHASSLCVIIKGECYFRTSSSGSLYSLAESTIPNLNSFLATFFAVFMSVFTYDGKIIWALYTPNCVSLCYQDKTTLDLLINTIENCNIKSATPVEKTQTMVKFLDGKTPPCPIYPDRNFDSYVSKHKSIIINHLDDMKVSLSGKSKFNGMGSYNFGMILHGKPGTGKTSIVKSVCNYLGRDALVVNMRNIKTCQEFEGIFQNYLNFVYILDEFDCVQGTISRDVDNDTLSNDSEKMKMLDEKYMKLLGLQSTENKETLNITKELELINKEIQTIKNKLTIDTMLTVLDGVVEMRGRVIIATTNYIDRIDSALIREGRFDLKIKLEEFNNQEIRDMLKLMYPEEDMSYLEDKIFKETYTPVQLISLSHRLRDFQCVVDELTVKN